VGHDCDEDSIVEERFETGHAVTGTGSYVLGAGRGARPKQKDEKSSRVLKAGDTRTTAAIVNVPVCRPADVTS
jgi:hypothetical protein